MEDKTCGECALFIPDVLSRCGILGVGLRIACNSACKSFIAKQEPPKPTNGEDALKAEVERLKKQVADREDEGYAGFVLGVDQMKKKLAEKDKEIERLKSDLGIQKNLTNQACFESNRAYQETEKWKKMFYDLIDKQSSVSTDPKVIVVGTDTDVLAKESEGEDE